MGKRKKSKPARRVAAERMNDPKLPQREGWGEWERSGGCWENYIEGTGKGIGRGYGVQRMDSGDWATVYSVESNIGVEIGGIPGAEDALYDTPEEAMKAAEDAVRGDRKG